MNKPLREDPVSDTLSQGLARLGLALDHDTQAKLLDYLALLAKWNRVYNLTANKTREQMVVYHLLDSLAVVPWLRGPNVIDVGTGAGLPGIPLALACPGLSFVLLDAQQKRTRFVRQVTIELALPNVDVVQARAADYRPPVRFATVISRAFASTADFVREVGHLCAPGGRILAMKGRYPDAELKDIPEPYRVVAVTELTIPGLDAERHLVQIASGRSE